MSATKIERNRPPGDENPDEHSSQRPRIGRRLGTAALLGALVVSLLLAVPGLKPVADEIGEMSTGWIVLAVALELASCLSFVVLFRRFFDRVPGRDARPLAWTSMASGALLPGGGVGGLAIGGWLIRLTGASTAWIIRRSSALFFFTTAINAAVVIIAALLLLGPYPVPDEFSRAGIPLLIVVPATIAIAALPWALRRGNRAPSMWLGGIIGGIRDAELTAARPSWRLLGALGYLGFDIAVLWATFSAVGHVPPIPALALGYTIGYVANAVPIPGGIGVLDAGLSGALVLYGASPARAIAAVLVYHAIAFWIPALGGIAAYASLRPRLVAGAGDGALTGPHRLSPTLEGDSHDRRSSDDRTHDGRLGRLPHERARARSLPRNRGAVARSAVYPPARPTLTAEPPPEAPERGPPTAP
ncbi:MAG TPA: YbhN family protein [Solirubrobacteraceae bacterium]|jgi:uncharacterized membrane protein YbhN (UPF0104 family)